MLKKKKENTGLKHMKKNYVVKNLLVKVKEILHYYLVLQLLVKLLMLKKKYMVEKKKIYAQKLAEINGGMVMKVKIMY